MQGLFRATNVSEKQYADIAARTVLQTEDITGEWELQRKGRLTASHFGEVAKKSSLCTSHNPSPVWKVSRNEGKKVWPEE